MKKSLAILTFTFLISGTNAYAVCVYQDCAQYVLSSKILLSTKISAALAKTSGAIENVKVSYEQELQAIEAQNIEVKKLKEISAKNNLTTKALISEQQKLLALIAKNNEFEGKKGEALHMQAELLSSIGKIKAEDR